MPCSINGNTHLERSFVNRFRQVYIHLCTSGAVPYLEPCTIGFANTRHMDSRTMQRALTFSPSTVASSEKLALHTRLCEAATACNDMGDLLIGHSRKAEGQFWCYWALKLCDDAEEARRREEIFKEYNGCQERSVETDGGEEMIAEAERRDQMRVQAREKSFVEVQDGLLVEVRRCVVIMLEAFERQKRSIKAARCERPVVARECDERPMSANKLGKRPMKSDTLGKRPMEADEGGEMHMSPNKCGKRPMYMEVRKREKRFLEANGDVVKRTNIEQLQHIFDGWLDEQLDGRPDGFGRLSLD